MFLFRKHCEKEKSNSLVYFVILLSLLTFVPSLCQQLMLVVHYRRWHNTVMLSAQHCLFSAAALGAALVIIHEDHLYVTSQGANIWGVKWSCYYVYQNTNKQQWRFHSCREIAIENEI